MDFKLYTRFEFDSNFKKKKIDVLFDLDQMSEVGGRLN